jgi:hypothetical protein
MLQFLKGNISRVTYDWQAGPGFGQVKKLVEEPEEPPRVLQARAHTLQSHPRVRKVTYSPLTVA